MSRAQKERAKEGLWIQEAIKKPGALRKALDVPEGKKIPEKKLMQAEHSKSPLMRKRATLAETLRHLPHKKGASSMSMSPKKMNFKGSSRSR